MEITLLVLGIILLVVLLVLQVVILSRSHGTDLAPIAGKLEAIERAAERTDRGVREEVGRNRDEASSREREFREEVTASVTRLSSLISEQINTLGQTQRNQLELFGSRVAQLSETVDKRLEAVQQENAAKLEQMRQTVDEKLHATLEKRLGESFKQVSERLELVHKGLGEMQSLAAGVGDLKRVLSNVKKRGVLGEVQLAALLEQILHPEQYETNVATAGHARAGRVRDQAARARREGTVWLPLDAKFPTEDYQRLQEAQDAADPVASRPRPRRSRRASGSSAGRSPTST